MTDIDQARDKIEDILSGKEYQVYYEEKQGFLEKWWNAALEWISEIFANVFGSVQPSNGFANGVLIILIIVVLVLVILAILFVVRSFKRRGRFQDNTPLHAQNEKDWTYLDHLIEARSQEDKENYPVATRHLFLALLLYFHEKGYVEARIWKTNWEYFEELRNVDKKQADSFYQLARIFDEVVYGEQTVEKESYVKYKEAVLFWIPNTNENGTLEG